MNSTRKTLLSLCSALLLVFGAYACKSSSSTTDVNTAGLNSSTGAYAGASGQPSQEMSADHVGEGSSGVGGRENVQAATPDTSYSGTGQSLITSGGAKTTTTTTTTYATPTVVATAPVAPNTTTEIVTTTPVVTETTTTTTETVPMTSSVQETTTTTTTPAEPATHTRMHKD